MFLKPYFSVQVIHTALLTPSQQISGLEIKPFSREPNCIFKSYLKELCIETSTSLSSLQRFEGAAGKFKGALGSWHPLVLGPRYPCHKEIPIRIWSVEEDNLSFGTVPKKLKTPNSYMLLVAYWANTELWKKHEKCLKPWHMGTHLRVLIWEYSAQAIQ